jgi:hypothetical protein
VPLYKEIICCLAIEETTKRNFNGYHGYQANRGAMFFTKQVRTPFGLRQASLQRTTLTRERPQLLWKLRSYEWWPGTESNRRRQPFQGCLPTPLSGSKLTQIADFHDLVATPIWDRVGPFSASSLKRLPLTPSMVGAVFTFLKMRHNILS